MINPTNGRQVWFHPNGNYPDISYAGQPLAATVVQVWSDHCVNLQVLDANGRAHAVTSVPLLQGDDAAPQGSAYAEWMPYQKGQAAKHDAKSELPAHVVRMVDEKRQLAQRLGKLSDFLGSDPFIQLTPIEQRLLQQQADAMSYYLQTLSARLALAGA